ncbi:hypothetical protein D3C73_1519460 [compost metagenome]
MGLVPAFGLGQSEQDLAFFAVAPLGKLPVDGGLGTLIGQILAPPADVRVRGRHGC